MKKVFLSFAVVAFMVSCGGAEQAATETVVETPVEEVAPVEEAPMEEVAPVDSAAMEVAPAEEAHPAH